MRIAFKNFGCRTNAFETDSLYLEAIRRGMQVVSESERADAYVINSCTVTANADRDARNYVYRYKRANPQARVAVIGCYAQVAKEELLKLSGVDYVLGTADKLRILDLLSENASRDQVSAATGFLPEVFVGSRHARANIKVQDGCNYRCTFCTIPLARGRSRSLPMETVESQVRAAAAQGFQEVVLTGIHLAHYGWEYNTDLKALVERLLTIPDGPRIRLSTLDPFEIPEGLLDLMANSPKFCPFFHIALQSGDDRILSRMKRLYTADEFAKVSRQIALRIPHAFIGVDVIVGFPGETSESFEVTRHLLQSTPWSKLHVFSFSARKGTVAMDLDGKVPGKEIARRSAVLRELSETHYQNFLREEIGEQRELLLERELKKRPGCWAGHTENFVPVEINLSRAQAKQIIPVRLTSASRSSVLAEMLAVS